MNDLNFSMQSLREQLINLKNVNKQLQQEIYVNNLIKLCELGLISKEDLKDIGNRDDNIQIFSIICVIVLKIYRSIL